MAHGAVAVAACCLLVASAAGAIGTKEDGVRKPLLRRDAYFGLHFDLHPLKTDTSLGADITDENLAALLDRVKPDYVQYDCKGHAGYTGYPTRVGWASPGIVKDSLAIWRKATKERGIGLFIHYSGVWDACAIEHHPEWARVGPDGQRDAMSTSVFGPYVDSLLIPQVVEAAKAYQLDGIWADGECWGAQLDWSPAALAAWTKETGFAEVPRKRGDPHWAEWKAFHRRHFESYLRHWVDAVHAAVPGFQVTSNWMYTTFAPKPIEVSLDYLSGDYSPTLSVDRARVESRYLANTGMPWDLMAWGFNSGQGLGQTLKTADQLKQEAAVVIMEGGGFSVYYQPTRSGYIAPEITRVMGEVGDFARARQKVSHKSASVPQVALLYSSTTQLDRSDAVFTPYGCVDEIEGALHALLESHYSVDLLAEHQLEPKLAQYPVVVIADSYALTDSFRTSLLRYVEGGGSLVLLGEKCARLFTDQLGVKLEGAPEQIPAELLTAAGVVNQDGVWQRVAPTTAEVIGMRYPTRDTRKGGEVAATLAKVGKGRIAAVYGPVALNHYRAHHPWLRQFVGDVMRRVFAHLAVQVEGPSTVDVALRHAPDGRLCVHLLNTTMMQVGDRYLSADPIPPVGPLTVRLRVPERPRRVTWVPDGGRLKWTWSDGTLTVMIPRLAIHGVVVVN